MRSRGPEDAPPAMPGALINSAVALVPLLFMPKGFEMITK